MILSNKNVFPLISVLLLIGCSHKENEPLPEIVQVERVIPYHIVVDGETVGSIAEQHGMTRAELVKLNDLTPPYRLYNGQRLVITVRADGAGNDNDGITVEEVTPTTQENNQEVSQGETDNATIDDLNNSGTDTSALGVPDSQSRALSENAAEIASPEPESKYVWPIANGKSKISQNFSSSSDGGVIMQASAGTPVKAMADGVVRIARALDGEASSYGKTVIILHSGENKLTVYSHLQEYSVQANQKVKKGDIIGKVGKSGNAKSPQLYFQVFDVNKADKSRVAIDPEKILP